MPVSTNTDLSGYKFQSNSSLSGAGDVSLYVKSVHKAKKRLDLYISYCEFDIVWIEIKNAIAKNTLCCCAYRHPSSNINAFIDHIQEALTYITNENKAAVIIGDFNVNLLNFENHTLTSDFIDTILFNHFQPLIFQPTRVTESTAMLIDNIFSNDFSCNVTSGSVLIQISDHFLQFSIFSKSAPDHNDSSCFV